MNLKILQDRLKKKYEITRFATRTSYVIHLGQKGCVIAQFNDDKLVKIIVDGKEKEEIEKLLLD